MRAVVLWDDGPDGLEVQIVHRVPERVEACFDFLLVNVLGVVEGAIDLRPLDGIQLVVDEVVVSDATCTMKCKFPFEVQLVNTEDGGRGKSFRAVLPEGAMVGFVAID